MQNFKKYSLVIGIIVVILAMVLVKTLSSGHFRNNADKWISPTINQSNLITTGRLKTLAGALVVDLSDNGDFLKQYNNAINIPADSLLDNVNQRKLRAHKGSIILVSDDQALSARIWMLLSQMGFTELFILNDSSNIEVLRYKFQHDTIARPES
jgi:hypothetical protein